MLAAIVRVPSDPPRSGSPQGTHRDVSADLERLTVATAQEAASARLARRIGELQDALKGAKAHLEELRRELTSLRGV
jgi:hypothetical protein